MSTIGSTLPTSTSSTSSTSSGTSAVAAADPYSSLTPSDFINMMVTQLQNQDPTQPTSNEQILQQISQIGQLQASDSLEGDLTAMTLQNSISSAGNLIGKTVKGTDSTGATSSGIVNSVQVQNGSVFLSLDSGKQMQLSNVTDIAQTASGSATSAGTTNGGTTTTTGS